MENLHTYAEALSKSAHIPKLNWLDARIRTKVTRKIPLSMSM